MTVVFDKYETVPLHEFHAELAFEFPALPEQLFDYYLIRTAVDMAKRGNIIRRRATIFARQGVTRYRLVSPDGCEPLHVMDVIKSPDCGCSVHDVRRSFAEPRGKFSCGRDIAWYDEHEQCLNVNPSFCFGDYKVEMSVTPGMQPCDLPSEYYDKYLPTLLMGVKSAILMITGRPWTNVQVGAALRDEYTKAVASDAIDTMSHKMRGGVKMRFGKAL